MAKKYAKSDKHAAGSSTSEPTLGEFLASLRGMKKMTLREVEEARTLFRRCEAAASDGAGIMSVDAVLPGPAAAG